MVGRTLTIFQHLLQDFKKWIFEVCLTILGRYLLKGYIARKDVVLQLLSK